MRRPNNSIPQISDETKLFNFQNYIRKIKERTSSSPSGRHYGHYKVMLTSDEKYMGVIHGSRAYRCLVFFYYADETPVMPRGTLAMSVLLSFLLNSNSLLLPKGSGVDAVGIISVNGN